MNHHKYKIMVSSAVYGFESELNQICAVLDTLKYNVLCSHIGTIKVDPRLSNMENCLNAVRECDLFFGIIRPYCGTGNIGDVNITFEEMKLAIELKKPYWFVVHHDVTFARKLCKKIEDFRPEMIRSNNFFEYRSVEMYNMVIKDQEAITLRTGNWAQEFYRVDEILRYIQTQFQDIETINHIVATSQK